MKKYLHISPTFKEMIRAYENAEYEQLLKLSDGLPINIAKAKYVLNWDDIGEHCELYFKHCEENNSNFRGYRVDKIIIDESLPIEFNIDELEKEITI
jgi:hypothetical protein